jgi:ABC-2 type transport system permease protein
MIHRLHWAKYLSKLIKDGQLSNYLIKPISLLPYTYADIVGVNFHKYFFGLLFLVVGLFTSGLIVEPIKLLLLSGFISIGITISYAINLFVAALSFYFTDTFVVQYVVQEAVKILSGALIPIFLFSETLQKILLNLPFAQLAYIPASLTLGESVINDYGKYLLLGVIWSIILNFLAYYFWKNALHKYEAIGI